MTIIDRPQDTTDHGVLNAPLPAGWFEDPIREHRLRYHDGQVWTDHVTHFGPSPCTGCGCD